jgi:hypothetical protein
MAPTSGNDPLSRPFQGHANPSQLGRHQLAFTDRFLSVTPLIRGRHEYLIFLAPQKGIEPSYT